MSRKIVKVDSTLEVRLSLHGGMFYVNIPKKTVDYYGLSPGDLLKVKILEAIKEVPEKEEASA